MGLRSHGALLRGGQRKRSDGQGLTRTVVILAILLLILVFRGPLVQAYLDLAGAAGRHVGHEVVDGVKERQEARKAEHKGRVDGHSP